MTLILPFLPESVDATIVINGVTYRPPIIDSDGHLQVDVLTSALPSGGATSARQDTMITALQLIDDLRGALETVAGDELRAAMRGWDGSAYKRQPLIFGFSGVYHERIADENADVTQDILTNTAVPADTLRVITNIHARDDTTALTRIRLQFIHDGVSGEIEDFASPAALVGIAWQGNLYLDAGDTVLAAYVGTVAGDNIRLDVHGYDMALAE